MALRFLGQLCDEGQLPPTNAFLRPDSIDNDRESRAHFHEQGKLLECPSTKQQPLSGSSNDLSSTFEPPNTVLSTFGSTEVPLSTDSTQAGLIMEVDTENAEYHTQVIKLEPEEAEMAEVITAHQSPRDQTPSSANTLSPRQLSSSNAGYLKCSRTRRKLSQSVQKQAVSPRNIEKRSIGKLDVQKKKTNLKCTVCDKDCTRKSDLINHMRTHTGEKPFKCEFCQEGFSVKSNLKVHRRKHTGERPFECETCHEKCTQKSNLSRHLSVHAGERPFKCRKCNSTFTRRYYLHDHQKKQCRRVNC